MGRGVSTPMPCSQALKVCPELICGAHGSDAAPGLGREEQHPGAANPVRDFLKIFSSVRFGLRRLRHREIDQAFLAVDALDDDFDFVAELELALGFSTDEGRARSIEDVEIILQ